MTNRSYKRKKPYEAMTKFTGTPVFCPCESVQSYVSLHCLDKPAVCFDSNKQLRTEYAYVAWLTANWMASQPENKQIQFAREVIECSVKQHWLDCYDIYFEEMMEMLQHFGTLSLNKTFALFKEGMDNAAVDILDTDKAQDILAKLRQDLPDMHDGVRQGVARLWAAGCIQEVKSRSKPLTGSEKRKLKKACEPMVQINPKELPKPKEVPPQDFHGAVTIEDKAVELPWAKGAQPIKA